MLSVESLQRLYDTRRTKHYYGTTVTTETQAERMQALYPRLGDATGKLLADTTA